MIDDAVVCDHEDKPPYKCDGIFKPTRCVCPWVRARRLWTLVAPVLGENNLLKTDENSEEPHLVGEPAGEPCEAPELFG